MIRLRPMMMMPMSMQRDRTTLVATAPAIVTLSDQQLGDEPKLHVSHCGAGVGGTSVGWVVGRVVGCG
jgi:hypothetical protein